MNYAKGWGVKTINFSAGGASSSIEKQAIQEAAKSNVLFVVAAGNECKKMIYLINHDHIWDLVVETLRYVFFQPAILIRQLHVKTVVIQLGKHNLQQFYNDCTSSLQI